MGRTRYKLQLEGTKYSQFAAIQATWREEKYMVDGQFQVCNYVACYPNYQIPE
jgi:hypothetical protein